MTPRDIIILALKQAGVLGQGQTPSAEDTNDAFKLLNMMMGQWNRKRWLIYRLQDVAFVSTGAASYTVGLGGNFNTARADRIQAAFVRLLNGPTPVDAPLAVITSREDYNRIAIKAQTGFPQAVFYDPTFPLGTLYTWPVALSGIYEIHLTLKIELAQFANLSEDIALPPEYQEALFYNLAGRLRPAYQLPPDPTVSALAKAALNTIRNANGAIPTMQMPRELVGGWGYNVYSDTVR